MLNPYVEVQFTTSRPKLYNLPHCPPPTTIPTTPMENNKIPPAQTTTPSHTFIPNPNLSSAAMPQQQQPMDNDPMSNYFSTDMDFDTAYMYLTGETDNIIPNGTQIPNNNNVNNAANSPTLSSILRLSPSLSNTQLNNLPFYGGGSPRNFMQNPDQLRPTTPVTEEYIKTVMNLESSNTNLKSVFEQQRRELLSKPPSFSLSPKHSSSTLNNIPLDNPYLNGTAVVGTSNGPLTPTNMFPDHAEQSRGSPISPNTKNLLTTFNTLNYNANTHSFFNNNNNNDLLSSSETDAIASFLDSIASNQSFENLSKHWHSIDPEASDDNINSTRNHHVKVEADHIRNQQIQDRINKQDPIFNKEEEIKSKVLKNNNNNNNSAAESRFSSVSRKNGITKPAKVKSRSKSTEASRKVLTEQEKKYNHTSSEQKRRALIKDAFDRLVDILSDSPAKMNLEQDDGKPKKKKKSTRKSLSKYHVMMLASTEIERLIQVNKQLSDLVGGNSDL